MIKYSKNVKHSVYIFEIDVLGMCVYRKLGKVI